MRHLTVTMLDCVQAFCHPRIRLLIQMSGDDVCYAPRTIQEGVDFSRGARKKVLLDVR